MTSSVPPPGPVRRRPRRGLLAVVAAAAVAATVVFAMSARAQLPPPPSGMTLVFSDDFSGAAGTGLNRANWSYQLGTGYPGGAVNWGTGEVETMTDSTANVHLDGAGHLAITPIRDDAGRWTSGRVETQRTDFAAPAGGKVRIEAALQQPAVSGAEAAGYWPAFWTLGAPARGVGAANWPGIGEWDVMEGINGRSSVFATLHCGTAAGGPCRETTGLGSGERPCAGCQQDFHRYAVEFDRSVAPEELRWYLDGTLIHRVTATQVDETTWDNATHHGMFIILNVAMGGGFPAALGGGPTAATRSGVPMLVDDVAVYQSGTATTAPATGPPGTYPPAGGDPTGTGPTTSKPTGTGPTRTAPTGTGATVPAGIPPVPRPATPAPVTPRPAPPGPGGTRDAYGTIEAESYDAAGGAAVEASTEGGHDVGWLADGDWLRYDHVDFGTGGVRDVLARVASGAGPGASGLVEVRIGSRSGPPIGSFAIGGTGGWQSWRSVPGNVSDVTGRQTVFLTFRSGQPTDFVNVNWLRFRR